MSEQPTARLYRDPYGNEWILRPTNRVWREPWWTFSQRHLAVQFAERRGIRIDRDSPGDTAQ